MIEELTREEILLEKFVRRTLWLLIAAPFLGGTGIYFLKQRLTFYGRFISDFNVLLFVLAASLRPVILLFDLAKDRCLYMQNFVDSSSSEDETMEKRIASLEAELTSLRETLDKFEETASFVTSVKPILFRLTTAIRRHSDSDISKRSFDPHYAEDDLVFRTKSVDVARKTKKGFGRFWLVHVLRWCFSWFLLPINVLHRFLHVLLGGS